MTSFDVDHDEFGLLDSVTNHKYEHFATEIESSDQKLGSMNTKNASLLMRSSDDISLRRDHFNTALPQ